MRAPIAAQARLEAAQLVGVLLHRQPAGEERDLAAAGKESREQLARDGADRERIRRDRRQAQTPRARR